MFPLGIESRGMRIYSQVQRIQGSSNSGSLESRSCDLPQTAWAFQARPVPVMLIGNNSDMHFDRQVSRQEGIALAQSLKCGFVETSARYDSNIERAFYGAVRLLRETFQKFPRKRDQRALANGTAVLGPVSSHFDLTYAKIIRVTSRGCRMFRGLRKVLSHPRSVLHFGVALNMIV